MGTPPLETNGSIEATARLKRMNTTPTPLLSKAGSGGKPRRPKRAWTLRAFFEDQITYMHDHPFGLAVVLLALNSLNLVDALLTVEALAQGAREVNPFMNLLFQTGTAQAVAFKLSLVAALSVILWGLRRFRVGLMAALGAACLYVIIAAYHMTLLVVL